MVSIDVLEIRKQVAPTILNIEGVSGFGASSGSPTYLNVYVESVTQDILNKIPPTIGGVATRVFQSGKFSSLQGSVSRTAKIRPCPMGVSVGLNTGMTGTAGALCYDNSSGYPYILSNNHVIAGSDGKNNRLAEIGQNVIAPGAYDGGTDADAIATLERWIELDENGPNYLDAGIARVLDPASVSDEILDLGKIRYVLLNVDTETSVMKSGRSSQLSQGSIIDTHATIKVTYPGYLAPIQFEDVIISTAIAIGGDSGSAALTDDMGLIGLVFAGTPNLTAICKIKGIMDNLAVNFNVPVLQTRVPSSTQPPAGVKKSNPLLPLLIGGIVASPAFL